MAKFAEALEHFQFGRLKEAADSCRSLLQSEPTNVSALNLLGVLAHQAGRNEEAVDLLQQAIKHDPKNGEALYNLAVAFQVLNRRDEAIATYRRCLKIHPGRAEAHNNLGHALLLKNQLDKAQVCFAEALRLRPDYAEALHNRGEAFRRQGRPADAVPFLNKALQLRPGFADAHVTLGRVFADLKKGDEALQHLRQARDLQPNSADTHNHLGLLYLQLGRLEDAFRCFEMAVKHNPEHADAHNNLGVVHSEQNRLEEATSCFYRALALDPEFASAHNNLGRLCEKRGKVEEAAARYRLALCYQPRNPVFHNNLGNALTLLSHAEGALNCYRQAVQLQASEPVYHSNQANAHMLMGQPEEAEACCRKALRLRKDHADARHNLAVSLASQGKFDEALEQNEKALRLEPEHPGARNCRALWWLQHGDFARGWAEYEWRWRVRGIKRREFREPAWDGSPLDGRTILLYAEQALGDTIQFIRYASLVKGRGGKVVVECQKPLAALLSTCAGIDQLVPRGSPLPPFDVQAALLSLPGLLGTRLETVPADVPYLSVDPARVASWGVELGERGLRVGIAFQGSLTFAGDRMRSAPLRHFAPLARMPSVRLFSLQKGPAREQIRALAREFQVVDLGSTLDEGGGAFLDTVAVMKNLDLVITSDTSIAHLAGALGVPVWVALSIGPDWRWLRDGERSPWYPTMRLFRQTRAHDWDEVFERMAAALTAEQPKPHPSAPAAPPRATVCLLTYGDYLPYFRRCLDSVLEHVPPGRIELRLGFNDAPGSLAHARQILPVLGELSEGQAHSGKVQRLAYTSRDGLAVRLWNSPVNLFKEPMARLLFHDLPLTTDYVVWLDDDSYVEEGWWQALCPLFERQVDYFGQQWWVNYLPGQAEMIRAQPWFRGVPLEHCEGRAGVWFMTGGFLAIRSERLREANFPDTEMAWQGDTLRQYGGDTLLGEIAHQLGWSRALFDTHVKVNVDLQDRHPAPRRGGAGRQFGSRVDVAVS